MQGSGEDAPPGTCDPGNCVQIASGDRLEEPPGVSGVEQLPVLVGGEALTSHGNVRLLATNALFSP